MHFSRFIIESLFCWLGTLPRSADLGWPSSLICKNISVLRWSKSLLYPHRLVPLEGRIAIVTDAGRDAVDAGGASDEGARLRTAKSCGPDAPTLASNWRRQLR